MNLKSHLMKCQELEHLACYMLFRHPVSTEMQLDRRQSFHLFHARQTSSKQCRVAQCVGQDWSNAPRQAVFTSRGSWRYLLLVNIYLLKPRYVRARLTQLLLGVANGQGHGAKQPDKGQQVLPVNIKTLHRLKEAHRMSAANRRKELPGRPSDIQSSHFAQLQA